MRLNQKCYDAESDHQYSSEREKLSRRQKKCGPAKNRYQHRQRVKPHFKGQAAGWPAAVQDHQSDGLTDELDEQAHRENRLNHKAEPETQAEYECSSAEK